MADQKYAARSIHNRETQPRDREGNSPFNSNGQGNERPSTAMTKAVRDLDRMIETEMSSSWDNWSGCSRGHVFATVTLDVYARPLNTHTPMNAPIQSMGNRICNGIVTWLLPKVFPFNPLTCSLFPTMWYMYRMQYFTGCCVILTMKCIQCPKDDKLNAVQVAKVHRPLVDPTSLILQRFRCIPLPLVPSCACKGFSVERTIPLNVLPSVDIELSFSSNA